MIYEPGEPYIATGVQSFGRAENHDFFVIGPNEIVTFLYFYASNGTMFRVFLYKGKKIWLNHDTVWLQRLIAKE